MPDRPQFIFGYGSLVESKSRQMTWASALYASPAIVDGIERGWFDQTGGPSYSTTYLGAVAAEGSQCNGVIFPISAQGLASYDQRETGYKRERINQANIVMLDGSDKAPDGDIWFYANQKKAYASAKLPIVQSYVDICLNGCLEIEATYPLAKKAKFAETFITTCSNWSEWWVNDRLYPRRAFIYQPNASTIDQLIINVLGQEMFSKIQIEPASWENQA
jgi:Gamma-glutamyl cyclotransferase, AIG2-like